MLVSLLVMTFRGAHYAFVVPCRRPSYNLKVQDYSSYTRECDLAPRRRPAGRVVLSRGL